MKGTKDYLSHQNVPGSPMKIINNNNNNKTIILLKIKQKHGYLRYVWHQHNSAQHQKKTIPMEKHADGNFGVVFLKL